MKRVVVVLLFLLLGTRVGEPRAQSVDAEETRLRAFFKGYLDELFRMRPLEATRLGDHRFDHLLDDISPRARTAWVAHASKALEDLPRRVDYRKLSRDAQIDFEIFQHDLKRERWLARN